MLQPPKNIQALVQRLNAEGKVNLVIKFADNRSVSSAIIGEVLDEASKKPTLLSTIYEIFKEKMEAMGEIKDECKKHQLDVFQSVIDHHCKKLKPKTV